MISPHLNSIAVAAAAPLGCSPALHPDDHLLHRVMRHRGEQEGVRRYFSGGLSDARQVCRLMDRLPLPAGGQGVLEFASGYGRVTRHLKALVGDRTLIASDIHPAAAAFLRDQIGVEAYLSSSSPEDLAIGDGYDLIVVMSLFSHLPDRTFGRWLAALYQRLAPGGFLMFTTHGEAAMDQHQTLADLMGVDGWGFHGNSDQPDIDAAEYGTMVVSIPYVVSTIRQHIDGAHIRSFLSKSWFGLQDEWIVQKPPM